MASVAETVVLKLQNEISGPADAASGALGRLEAQVLREQGALGRLETSLTQAKAKLAALAEGSVDTRAVAAFEQQSAAVGALQAKLVDAQGTLAIMSQARVDPATFAGAANEVARLSSSLTDAQSKLAGMSAGGAVVDVAAYQRQANAVAAMGDRAAANAGRIEALKEKLADLAGAAENAATATEPLGQMNVGGDMGDLGSAAAGAGADLGKLTEASQRLAGPMGEKVGKLRQFGEAIAQLGPYGIAAAAALLVAVAAIVAIGAAFGFAVTSAGAYRDEMLKLAGETGGNIAAASELQGAITRVASSSALARDKIADYAGQLSKAGVKGGELERALQAMAVAGSAGGDEMAAAFLKSAEAAAKTGASVDDLSKAMVDKLGGVAAAQALSLGVQMSKLGENIRGLFSGAEIEPLLKGFQSLLSIFDQTSASGQSMRASIASVMNAIIGVVLKSATAMVNLYIAVRQNAVVWGVLKGTVIVIAGVFALIAAAVVAVVAGLALLIAIPALIVGAFVAAFAYIKDAVMSAVNWLRGLSIADIGTAMIGGLAAGIGGGAGALVGALMGAVKGAVSSVKGFLGISSPSKLMASYGENTSAGMAQGIDAGASDVQASATAMASGAATGAAAAPVAATAKGGKTFAPVFTGCTFGSVSRADIEAMMRAIFEAESLDAGAPA